MSGSDRLERFHEGVELFNRSLFFEAHEAWESIWLECRGEAREFISAMIQLAAAFLHLRRGNERGAERLFRRALEKLEGFPPGYCGVDRSAAVAEAKRRLAPPEGPLAEPLLTLFPGWRSDALPLLR